MAPSPHRFAHPKPTPRRHVLRAVSLILSFTLWFFLAQASEAATAPKATQTQHDEKASPELDWTPYIQGMQSRIRKQWQPPTGANEKLKTRLGFRIHRNGEISHIKMLQSSGNEVFDATAKKALMAASPVETLPEAYPKDVVNVDFVFDYVIEGKSKAQSGEASGEQGADSMLELLQKSAQALQHLLKSVPSDHAKSTP